jgi:mono/diheme cytochrome c family protein
MRKILLRVAAILVVGFLAIQLVPYGRDHANPPVSGEPAWDSPQTRAVAVTSCFDCHSNETHWPWYSNIAPFSWLLQRHVDEGRRKLNFSEWGSGGQESDEIVQSVRSGEMPTWDYQLIHPDARLSGADEQAFLAGLAATFGEGEGGKGASRAATATDDASAPAPSASATSSTRRS